MIEKRKISANIENINLPQAVSYCLADAQVDDIPLIYVSDGFCKLTGYEKNEILGHNCRFLQGEDTNKDTVAEIRQAIQNSQEVHVYLLNYRKDGTTFLNALHMIPIFTKEGKLTRYLGMQYEAPSNRDLKPDEKPNDIYDESFIASFVQLINNLCQPIVLSAEMLKEDQGNTLQYANYILEHVNTLQHAIVEVIELLKEIKRGEGDVGNLLERLNMIDL